MPYSLLGKTAFLGDELCLEIQPQLCTVLRAAEPCLFCPMATVTHTAQTGREIILTCPVTQGLAHRLSKIRSFWSAALCGWGLNGDFFVPSHFSDEAYI